MPDLSLQISPPVSFPNCELIQEMGGYDRSARKSSYSSSSTTDSGSCGSDLSHENGLIDHHQRTHEPNLSLLGFEMVQNFQANNYYGHGVGHYQPQIYGRDKFKRNSRSTLMMNNNNGGCLMMKRNVRAPRMRWTSTLHAHFVHAVQLLGGHERMYSLPPSLRFNLSVLCAFFSFQNICHIFYPFKCKNLDFIFYIY